MTLKELHEYIQQPQTAEELDAAFNEIFDSDEESDENKRLREGPRARLFKLAAEELHPLITWLKVFAPSCRGHVVDGSQPFDAVVTCPDGQTATRLEFGLATDGYHERLLNETLTKDGHASPNSEFGRIGKGKEKSVATTKERTLTTSRSIVERQAELIRQIAEKNAKKGTSRTSLLSLLLSVPWVSRQIY